MNCTGPLKSKWRDRETAKSVSDPPEGFNPFINKPLIPPYESQEERNLRLRSIQEAQRVSRKIDDCLFESRKQLERRKRAAKILLLGQSESGKSAILKNFQIAFTPQKLDNERDTWRKIIHLNLISNVKTVLSVLQQEFDSSNQSRIAFLDKTHRRLLLALSPLLSVDTTVNSMGQQSSSRFSYESSRSVHDPHFKTSRHDFSSMLQACKDDIISLWMDPTVRQVLLARNILMHSLSGFFLDDTARVASVNYVPTDADIVRARVVTTAVEEHHFVVEKGTYKGAEFYIMDVAGSRTARTTWIPYFDDANAILFLAPLSFHQTLEEDPRINRLEDTIFSWKELCASLLLANCNIILLLNKKDVLQANLDAGMIVNHFVPSYGDLPNDVFHVTKYFKDRFRGYHKRLSPKPRPFISYETSAIDTHSTIAFVLAVQEGIFRDHLSKSGLIS